MGTDPVQAMDGLIDRLVSVLGGGSAAGQGAAPTSAAAADGMIRATVRADGRVDALTLDPKLLRTPGQIAPGIMAAVNDAIAARPEGTVAAPASRIEALQAIQHDSLELTKDMNASLLATLERLQAR